MIKTKKVVWLCIVFAIIGLFTFFIYAANGDILPNNGAIISSVCLIGRNTGTGPFDDNDEPGNDSSASNNIVRSFDQITWTIENTMTINDTGDQYYTGGTIYFEASLPSELKELVKWNTDSMKWIENLQVSEDSMTICGKYTMPTEDVTIPGKQSLVFVLDIFGAPNGTEIQPTFTTWLEGNSNSKKQVLTDEVIKVSAAPAYNLEIVKSRLNRDTYIVDPNDENSEIKGKVFGYGVVLSLNNKNSEEKGAKGIEYPRGKITFDIGLDLSRYGSENFYNGSLNDVVIPLLYQYSIDGQEDNLAYNDGRDFFDFYGGDGYYYPFANRDKYGIASDINLANSIYHSGDYSLVQEGDTIHVTLNNYEFDGYFPTGYCYDGVGGIRYGDERKNFSLLVFQLFIPINDETQKEGTYYITTTTENMKATSSSGVSVEEQSITTDDENCWEFLMEERGIISKFHRVADAGMNYWINNSWASGDAAAYKGSTISLVPIAVQSSDNSPTYDRAEDGNFLCKFDGDCFEPNLEEYDIKSWPDGDGGIFEYDVYYASKSDGTNWISQEEQNNARIEDLKYYSSLDELYNDGNSICVGILLESKSEWWWANSVDQIGNNNLFLAFPVKIKETASVGQTYSFTSDLRIYDKNLDRSIDSVSVEGFSGYSEEEMVDLSYSNYIKTEYNDNGQIIKGTHDSTFTGSSVLIVDAKSSIDIGVTQVDSEGNQKLNYDYAKNEYNVDYILSPTIIPCPTVNSNKEITVYVKAILDYRCAYISGTCNYGDPEVTFNEYGDTILTWEINNHKLCDSIEPITFSAHLSEDMENGDQITNYATIFAPEVDIRDEWLRSDNYTIEIINLASHRLYKTTDTLVTEKDGEIHYTISYKNNTDSEIPDFQLLDILPYNGDSRGSNFNGTYKINKIDITQWDGEGNELVDNDNLIIKYTNDESIRDTINVKDTNLAEDWTEVDSYIIDNSATALAIIGNMGKQQKIVLDIYLKPDGNKGGDIYYNNATARVYVDTEEMVTPSVKSTVVERKISGYVWMDSNKNGIMDDDEQLIPNVEMVLTDSVGNSVIDVNGNIINSTLTNLDGYYEFNYLPEDNYIVSVVIDGKKYKLTEKEVGYNSEVNSKFNSDTQKTDIITKLNSNDLPVMEEKYQNVGLVLNSGKIKVVHVLEKTDVSDPEILTDVLYPTEIYEGNIGDNYDTVDRLSEINNSSEKKYELKSKTENFTGTYSENIQYIIYYYNLLGKITLTKLDFNDNTIKIEGAKYRLEKLDDDGNIDTNFSAIEQYTNTEGIIIFDDLSVGKYKLTEIEAPEGYELSNISINIEIDKDNTDIKLIDKDKHKLDLPATGGIGIAIFVTLGAGVMIVAAVMNKKQKAQE
ncbi:MAG: SpaA isopeptide-forming pilin-related protein [Clostridia bacterium]